MKEGNYQGGKGGTSLPLGRERENEGKWFGKKGALDRGSSRTGVRDKGGECRKQQRETDSVFEKVAKLESLKSMEKVADYVQLGSFHRLQSLHKERQRLKKDSQSSRKLVSSQGKQVLRHSFGRRSYHGRCGSH